MAGFSTSWEGICLFRGCVTDKCWPCRGVGYVGVGLDLPIGTGEGAPDINLILGGCHWSRIGRFWWGVCNIVYAGMCGCNQVFG